MQIINMPARSNSSLRDWGLLLVLIGLLVIFGFVEVQYGSQRTRLALETEALWSGQVYRVLTAHFVHLSQHHTFMNGLGLGLVACTFLAVLRARDFLWATLICMLGISLGWWILQQPGPTYVGFSGTLHGIFAFGALMYLRQGHTSFGWFVVVALSIKLGYEILQGPVPGTESAVGGRVSTLSHGLGAFAGAVAGRWHPIAKPFLILLGGVAIAAAVLLEHSLLSSMVGSTLGG